MRAPITDNHLLEMMWERFTEIMKRGAEQPAQRTWVSLTDEDVRQCSRDVVAGGPENSVDRFAYAIEAKLKQRNQ